MQARNVLGGVVRCWTILSLSSRIGSSTTLVSLQVHPELQRMPKKSLCCFYGHLLQVPRAPVRHGFVLHLPCSIEWIEFGASMQNFVRNIPPETLWNADSEVKLGVHEPEALPGWRYSSQLGGWSQSQTSTSVPVVSVTGTAMKGGDRHLGVV